MNENTLGLFHTELLGFLQHQAQKKVDEEGYDPKSDPLLQTFFKELSPKTDAFALEEIVDRYQYLFNSRGPLHVEKILLEAFPIEDFIELGLQRYYPRIYRGLPRLYLQNQPTKSRTKKVFTHLPSLKKQAFAKALFSLYAKVKVQGKVTLFTWVMNDGFGDYIAAVEVLRLLRGRLPDLDIHFVGLVPVEKGKSIKLPENALLIPYQDEPNIDLISEEALNILSTSDLILQIPTYYPKFDELLAKIGPHPKVESVGQYGYIESDKFNPKTDNYSLGLHFLEKGILIRKPLLASWDDVENKDIQNARSPENRFYLAYLSSSVGGAIYLHSLLKSLEFDSKGVDICVPDLDWFFRFAEKQEKNGRSILEWDLGVGSIEVIVGDKISSIHIADSGKKLRLICPENITQSDFRALLALSGDWVAVRGDQSFSEAVSQGKAFFYDGREHARYFIKDLLALAENRIGDFQGSLQCIRGMNAGFIYNLAPETEGWVDEVHFQETEEWTSIAMSIGLNLQDPETVLGLQRLNKIIVDEFLANSFLCHLVQRGLYHKAHPEIEKKEALEVERFTRGKQSLKETVVHLKGDIS